MIDDKIKSKMQKLKILAERGCSGEKENAGDLLERMCKKYHISVEQIESSDTKTMHWFRHRRDKYSERLLSQCMYKTLGIGRPKYTRAKVKGGKPSSEIGVECTTPEAIEIELDYTFYTVCLDTEIERLYDMFIQKNNIFPPNSEKDAAATNSDTKITREDIAMYQAIKRQTRVAQITGGYK